MDSKHVLILTYEMDELSQVFSHQIGIVNEIAKYFDNVTVLTGKVGSYKVSKNVMVYSSNWKSGNRISSAFRFLILFLRLSLQKRFTVVFSHMASVQAAIISPITRVLGIKHYLWYTHKSDNFALRFCHFFTNGILTATLGSCPISSAKVFVVGHSIDTKLFTRKPDISFPIEKFVHVGRFDPSKNIDLIITALAESRSTNSAVTFSTIGEPSGPSNVAYYEKLTNQYLIGKSHGWINFQKSVPRNTLPQLLANFDCFVHAFKGSLDKAVLEATLVTLPVATINKEYLNIFGSWDLANRDAEYSLEKEIEFLLSINKVDLIEELNRRYKIAQKDYELEGWARRVIEILNN
jgi:glycosyltransferase involved in cell wall biosynthesis